MARRYSASEKAKWTHKSTSPVRRAPIPIPRTDNSALIDQNKLTLIGRVSNPSAQNTHALVDFFLQHWHVLGSITGRELGPHLFQFSFESERDLQSILNKAPYHFKRWMIMLQRWEPTVSESFPSVISFWIRIHGLPLHYWTEPALEAVGSALGHVEFKDATKARIRVHINGLRPLERHLEVSLPSGEILQVELEYEGLHKHCFSCQSLSHEQDNCPSRTSALQAPMGINQSRTLERLAERRRHEGHTSARPSGERRKDPVPQQSHRSYQGNVARPGRHTKPPRDGGYRDERRYASDQRRPYDNSPPRRSVEHKKEVWIPRTELSDSTPKSDPRTSGRLSVKTARQLQTSEVSHTPPPRPPREPMLPAMRTHSDLSSSRDRRPALERISPAASLIASSERRPALERTSLPSHRDSLPLIEDNIVAPGQLQSFETQGLEERLGDAPLLHKSGDLGSKAQRGESSPIRTLSEDRLHVSMRLGPLPTEPDSAADLGSLPKRSGRLAAKVLGKRKSSSQPTKTVPNSPSHGVSIKRRRVTKTQGSPKRKLAVPKEGTRKGPKTGTSTSKAAPSSKVFPASKKKVADFQPPRNPLP